ncbi:MAG: hypothetical protein RR086_00490 [Clostridia bacterium]
MIKVIYGPKGSGKTKKLIDATNDSLHHAKGAVIYIDKDYSRIHDLEREVRLINAFDYDIATQTAFLAFVKGMLATNSDIEYVYIDGLAKIVHEALDNMQEVYDGLTDISEKYKIHIVLTASAELEALPPFVKAHINK